MPIDTQKLLSDLQSDNPDVRFAAWYQAGEAAPAAVPELAKLAVSENPGVAKAAREALRKMVHAAGKEAGLERPAVVQGLLGLLRNDQPQPVRVLALRLLSHIGGDETAGPVSKLLGNGALREEAVFCLERIPGRAAAKVLIDGYRTAAAEFKPRILAALGHRREEDAVSLCLAAMRSADQQLALAATKAFGRIGKKPAAPFHLPDPAKWGEWGKIEHMDSLLRYADSQAAQGNAAEATRIYKQALDREEEHWQAAAIIGMAKLGTPEAAAAILPKLKSGNAKVRITAEKAWDALKASAKG